MKALLDLIFPMRCAGCGRYDSAAFCVRCQGAMAAKPVYFQLSAVRSALALGSYEGALRTAVIELKFKHKKELAGILADRLCGLIKAEPWSPDLIVPAPMAASRNAERGYNQARVLSEKMADTLEIPFSDCLRISRRIAHQVGLGHRERVKNVEVAFSVAAE